MLLPRIFVRLLLASVVNNQWRTNPSRRVVLLSEVFACPLRSIPLQIPEGTPFPFYPAL